jgi:signal transduction histidine kinase
VKDTGIGIAPENHARIFERFFRDESNTLVIEAPGTGLGLSIVKDYVEMHDGDIWLDSEIGKGTTFFVRFPVFNALATNTLDNGNSENATPVITESGAND